MAKIKKSCPVARVRFQTKRGRVVEFKGRSAGQDKCGHKARKVSAWQHKVGLIGRACMKKGKPGTAANAACIRSSVRAQAKGAKQLKLI